MDVALAVMAGVEQQRGAALDADMAKAEKQRAVRLAVPLMRNSSPLALARSISGWKSRYQPPLPNRSEVAAKAVDEIRTSASAARARKANLPGS
jgi:hypothetical protein